MIDEKDSVRPEAKSHRRRRGACGDRRLVQRARRRSVPLRDGDARSRHRVGRPGGGGRQCGDGLRQPRRHDPARSVAGARRHPAGLRRQPLRQRQRHDGFRRQRRQRARLHSRAGRLLRLQRYARSQARHLAGVELRAFGRVPKQLVGPVLRHEVGADHPRRLPVAAYRVNEWLSIGGGAQILYGRLNSKTAVRNVFGGPDGQIQLKSNDVGAGGIAGILIEPMEGTRFGVSYNSPVKLDFKENPDLRGGGAVFNALDPRISNAKIDPGLTVPQQVMLSGYHDLTDTIAIMGNVVWQQWSQFGEPSLEIPSTNSRKATANLNYDDTWGFALGGRYRFAPDWQWSLGVAFDTSPMSKSQRTPALPLDQQVRVGTGVQYALNDRATIGAAYEYLNLGEADIDRERGPLAGRIQGNYSTNEIHFFNATLSWKF